MASEGGNKLLHGLSDYEAHFNPREYLERFFSTTTSNEYGKLDFFTFRTLTINECFKGLSGKRFIDIGSGPSICGAVAASPYFDELYLADFLQSNLDEINLWLENSSTAFDWTTMLKCYANLEEPKTTVETLERRVRSKIKGVLRGDVMKDGLFEDPSSIELFDGVICAGCLDSACQTYDDYIASLKRINKIIVPGGHLIFRSNTGLDYYGINGNIRYYNCSVTLMQTIHAIEAADFKIIKCHYQHFGLPPSDKLGSFDGAVILLAQKN